MVQQNFFDLTVFKSLQKTTKYKEFGTTFGLAYTSVFYLSPTLKENILEDLNIPYQKNGKHHQFCALFSLICALLRYSTAPASTYEQRGHSLDTDKPVRFDEFL